MHVLDLICCLCLWEDYFLCLHNQSLVLQCQVTYVEFELEVDAGSARKILFLFSFILFCDSTLFFILGPSI